MLLTITYQRQHIICQLFRIIFSSFFSFFPLFLILLSKWLLFVVGVFVIFAWILFYFLILFFAVVVVVGAVLGFYRQANHSNGKLKLVWEFCALCVKKEMVLVFFSLFCCCCYCCNIVSLSSSQPPHHHQQSSSSFAVVVRSSSIFIRVHFFSLSPFLYFFVFSGKMFAAC